MTKLEIINLILAERVRQDLIHGKPTERKHGLDGWITILAEEIGEVAAEVQMSAVRAKHSRETRQRLTTELVQVAAVAIAMIESLEGIDGVPD